MSLDGAALLIEKAPLTPGPIDLLACHTGDQNTFNLGVERLIPRIAHQQRITGIEYDDAFIHRHHQIPQQRLQNESIIRHTRLPTRPHTIKIESYCMKARNSRKARARPISQRAQFPAFRQCEPGNLAAGNRKRECGRDPFWGCLIAAGASRRTAITESSSCHRR